MTRESTIEMSHSKPTPHSQSSQNSSHESLLMLFERAWARGEPERLEDLLTLHRTLPEETLCELLAIDLEHRFKRGESTRVEAYVQLLPQLMQWPSRLVELLLLEYHLRRKTESGVQLEEYRQRYPDVFERLVDAYLEGLDL